MCKPSLHLLLVVVVLVAAAAPASAAAADLDPSFGSGGKLATGFGGGATSYAAGMDARGPRIAIAGTQVGSDDDLGLLVLNPDGDPDPTFSGDGRLTLGWDGAAASDDNGRDVSIRPDRRIMVAGNRGDDALIVVLKENGRPDRGFGTKGKIFLDLGGQEVFNALAVDNQGRIVAAGTGGPGSFLLIARFTATGSLDTSFGGGDGYLLQNLGNTTVVRDVAVRGSKAVAAGRISSADGSDAFLVRTTADGQLDATFAGDGSLTADLSASTDEFMAVTFDAGGRIVATGRAGTQMAVARYLDGGEPDAGFAGVGLAVVDAGAQSSLGAGIQIQDDGRLVVAGRANDSFADQDNVLVRLKEGGRLDPRFSGDGIRKTSFSSSGTDTAVGLDIDPRGRIVVAGTTGTAVTVAAYFS